MPPLLEAQLLPLIGESAWHSLIVDPRIAAESERHTQEVTRIIRQYGVPAGGPLQILEVACYAHTSGYALAQSLGAQVTLFELSAHSLRLGKELGKLSAEAPNPPRLVMGDFHNLPFADNTFNVVYICSALHHSWNYPQVLRELTRVLAPQGLLFLENEPTLRSLCFYKFRCNRPHDFSPLEAKLHQLGLLTTLAEPYLGSRPESLFGMVENQSMPLPTLLEITEESCDILSVYLSTSDCMGNWEKTLLQRRQEPAWKLAAEIEATLLAGTREVLPWLTPQETGSGRTLPQETEIRALAQRVAKEIHALPPGTEETFALKVSEIFGAPLQLVARKKNARLGTAAFPASTGAFNGEYACLDGVYIGFPGQARDLLTQPSLAPDVQSAPEAELQKTFPTEYWHYVNGDYPLAARDALNHSLRSLLNKSSETELTLPEEAAQVPTLLVLRLFCALQGEHYYQLELSAGNTLLGQYAVYQPDSILLRANLLPTMLPPGPPRVKLTLRGLQAGDNGPFSLAVNHLMLYKLSV
jgi:ubiquinone/menaquinone biosynthesis C-methylase UbiE